MTRQNSKTTALGVVMVAVLGMLAPGRGLHAADANAVGPKLVKQGNVTQLVVEGTPFIMLGGELHNSSASSLQYMEPIWPKLRALNLNTVLATVSWELFEPEEGRFDYTLVDGLVQAARSNKLRLVVLWFGSWKNGVSSYAPAWVKKDTQRFPRVKGRNGNTTEVLTPLAESSRNADAKAFAALMKHIREIDLKQQTVAMMQVENEAGLLGDSRDRSPLAEAEFAKAVPAELTAYFQQHKETLIPEFKAYWEAAGFKTSGTWTEVFGEDADEAFMAWNMAKYIGAVITAGKAQHPIPMYVNAWLVQREGQHAGGYPSGGPVSKVMDIYRAAAPQIDLLAPDIYLPDFRGVCASYLRSGNPLFIPEASRGTDAAQKAIIAILQFNALGFCPFGIDSLSADHPLGPTYKLLDGLMPAITANQGAPGRIAVLFQPDGNQRIDVGDFRVDVRFTAPAGGGGGTRGPSTRGSGATAGSRGPSTRGAGGGGRGGGSGGGDGSLAIIIAYGLDEYIIGASGCEVRFSTPRTPGPRGVVILSADEGRFSNGNWLAGRRLNGDETGANDRLSFRVGEAGIQRVKLYRRD